MKNLTSILIITICVGLYFLYINPQVMEVRALVAKKAEYNNVLEKARELKETRDNLLIDYNSIPRDDLEKLDKIIPDEFESTILLNELNVLASKYGLQIKDFDDLTGGSNTDGTRGELIEDETSSIYKTNKVSIALTGQYRPFRDFLDDLESNLRLMDVVSLTIKSGEGGSGGVFPVANSLDFLIEMNVYSLK